MYIIKQTIISLKTLDTTVYYSGSSDNVYIREESVVTPFVSKRKAMQSISNDMKYDWYKKLDDFNYLQHGSYLLHYEIIER